MKGERRIESVQWSVEREGSLETVRFHFLQRLPEHFVASLSERNDMTVRTLFGELVLGG
jgi:hypothetical protein